MNYRIVEAKGEHGPVKVTTTAYYYSIENKDKKELVAYHWHPEGTSIPFPHIHVGKGVIEDKVHTLQEKHFPTGRIALEQVLALAVEEFGVRPIKPEWKAILGETLARFEKWKTW